MRKKWNSSRGASILMALLFLLVCMMAGASILMAAASNAGKIKSNQEEQQRYLTLSSALTLLCDELERVEYVGKYRYTKEPVYRVELDDEGNEATVLDYYRHTYRQEQGELRENGSEWELKRVLPLYNDLDALFAGQFEVPTGLRNPIDSYGYTPLTVSAVWPESPHTLELTAGTDTVYGGLSEPVSVTVQLRSGGGILVTATLKNYPEYIMEAMLQSNKKPDQLLVLDVHTGSGAYETKPVKWTLNYIVKKEAGG